MLWVQAFHIIFVVTWFAALFYLPRLFVYHAQTDDAAGNARFKIMERKLYRGIMTPSALLVVGSGIWLLSFYDLATLKTMGWLHAKLTRRLVPAITMRFAALQSPPINAAPQSLSYL